MGKKVLYWMLIVIIVFGFSACGDQGKDGKKIDVALVTDGMTVSDKSFNQYAWEGIVSYCKKEDKTYKQYEPKEQTAKAYEVAIKEAEKEGAEVIVTPGVSFESVIFKVQSQYPKTHFILLDGFPNNGDKENRIWKTDENAVGIKFAEEEAGYLAGYGAVKDGYRKLGFMGGEILPSTVCYGYGFVQGADAAAKEMQLSKGVEVKYHYTGDSIETPKTQKLALSWYKDETEVIFSCGGSLSNSVIAAAQKTRGKVIGADIDRSEESKTVVTSAVKSIGEAVNGLLYLYYDNKFPGGKNLILDASAMGVGLPMETSRFTAFNKDDYEKIYKKLAHGNIKILKNEIKSVADLGAEKVKVLIVH